MNKIYNLLHLLLLLLSISLASSNANPENFLECMSNHSIEGYIESFKSLNFPGSLMYAKLLQSAEQNPRWLNDTTLKPELIITPYDPDEIRLCVVCSKRHGYQVRVKSGGHDYEGLSYLCRTPFVLVDLVNLRSISIDSEHETAWVQAGATLGELYYSISQKSNVHGFPGGLCPSVGVGGHLSGGGLGTMVRAHGLAADNILDAYIMDAEGKILDRRSMGEDLFWAIRGGGAASYGVVVAWKIKLVRVPPAITVFTVSKNLNTSTEIVNKWQYIASKMPNEMFMRVVIQYIEEIHKEKKAEALFNSLFLGPKEELLPLMKENFPELGLQEKDCKEMSWIESTMYFAGFQNGEKMEALLDRTTQYKSYFKAKSDFVEKPMPERVFREILEKLLQEKIAFVIMDPLGGKMDEISINDIPFPHRKGNLFNIQYLVKWDLAGEEEAAKHLEWIRVMYRYMKPYVSNSPRTAYMNYRDLDLGINKRANTSFSEAKIWGKRYFKGNFKRLAQVKARVDPWNFFRHEQSIPVFSD